LKLFSATLSAVIGLFATAVAGSALEFPTTTAPAANASGGLRPVIGGLPLALGAFASSEHLTATSQFMPLSVFEPMGAAAGALKQRIIGNFCDQVLTTYRSLGWRDSPCAGVPWQFDLRSETGHPLVYWEFIDREAAASSQRPLQTTLIFGGVHPDEITPIHLAFAFARRLSEDSSIYNNARVIIAPLVNPDGFFVNPKSRTNANGIDLNRNFAPADWWQKANKMWRNSRRNDPRHFPGQAPHTEQGTRFQAELIDRFDPDKILTIHAPLGFLDYDGPGDASHMKRPGPQDFGATNLAKVMSLNTRNFRVIDYSYFPGSLGNFAGNDRKIPTLTIELNTTDPRQALAIRNRFFPGLRAAVGFEIRRKLVLVTHGDVPPRDGPLPGKEHLEAPSLSF
jgi:protein MpaA